MNLNREDVVFVASTVAVAAGAIAGLTFDPALGTIMTAAGAIFATAIGFLKARRAEQNALAVANIGADASIETNSKTVLVQTVTAERAKWRMEMREGTAELVMLLRSYDRSGAIDWARVDRLRAELRLRLNPEGRKSAPPEGDRHELDRKIHATLNTVAVAALGTVTDHVAIADTLEAQMAELLKAEWDKSKEEAVTGTLKAA